MEWCCAPCQKAPLTMVLSAFLARGRDVCRRNGLLILSVLSVIVGCLLGFFLRTQRLSPQEISYFQFPGELLMRMLKMLILPLVVSSLMSGLASLDAKTSSRLGILTVAYYLWTTFLAVIVGIIMVSIIHPGGAAQKEITEQSGKPVMSSADALLDLIRNMFPANLVEATFKQYRTKSTPVIKSPKVTPEEASPRRILIYGVQEENGSRVQNFALDLTPAPEVVYKSEPGTSDGMNVLGIVIFSATMGIMLGRMGDSGAPLVSFCQCLNESVMKIVALAVWYFPFGIVFLIAGKILEMDDPKAVRKKLGFYAITVVCGLVVHGLFILPLLYFLITRKNPIVFIRGVLQALLIALATSSSSATLPITFKCLLENNHIDRRIARFVLPVGATINMDGTALYEAVAAIFIAQVNNYELDFGQIITISITATAASIGAAGIPQAGLVTMVIVLTSVGLPTDDINLIIAVDWALDRFRTMINVLGDALAAGIMAHICRKDFARDTGTTEKLLPCETKPMSLQEIVATQQNGCVKSVAEPSELTLGPACPHHVPVQVEQDEEPAITSLDHCTIEISELETNV
ncbi:excitatory amino acid transporter 5 isoform X1 [Ictidomys tridecemlineatus]|uniref:Amino acid transporter n=2 Tax=Ictidomys tridecemlineatus TaxID=43179 RepID=I3N5S3_ICTTR|nr:excitatory amino acid transporter 5 isoform X1 [Ictidomys tridecemlineatus]KAG3283195.1 solute carrier family 1 member 7, transcript variant X1 [Ictidomys tridecemlineatus]